MSNPGIHVRLLGGFAIEADGHPVSIEARKNRGLIAILALSPRRTTSRERLVELLWSDRGEEQARASLRQSLAILRKDLGNVSTPFLTNHDEAVALNTDSVDVDVTDFIRLAAGRAEADLRKAARLYTGELLDGIAIRDPSFEDWLAHEQRNLIRLITDVLDRLMAFERGQAAVATAHRLVDLDPLRESSHRHVMRVHADLGEPALALKQFEACKRILREELGVEPSPVTAELKARIAGGGGRETKSVNSVSPVQRKRPTEKPMVAVLPFANLSGDPGQDYFSDGITEDVIIELSRFRNMGVIARNSSFAYRSRNIGIDFIGKELGASYVLDGSVRKSGSRVRITARLSDVGSGSQVWAERYDRDVADIFELQDELSRNIAGTLAIELDDRELETARARRMDDSRAYELFLLGKRQMWAQGDGMLEGRGYLEKSTAIDPTLARAHAALAVTYVHEALQFPPAGAFEAALAAAHESAHSALSLDPTECFGHMSLAWVYLYRRDYERMKWHIDHAIKLNPNDADMLANASYMLACNGDAAAAIAAGEAAIKLNPRHPDWYAAFLSMALFTARRYEESWQLRGRSAETFYDSLFLGSAALAYLGRLDEARQWGKRAVARLAARLGADVVAEKGCIELMLENNPYRRQADQEHFAEGMRRAEVPGRTPER